MAISGLLSVSFCSDIPPSIATVTAKVYNLNLKTTYSTVLYADLYNFVSTTLLWTLSPA
jgi:hypothetical protein